ncbi:hypothetical protein [Tropicimonas sp. S265A]|uniref:hypothetical protein n=1 Tax=Tropicimonas sp. S265A TaxID=3415134 RepID=UPI003C7B6F66
MLIRSLVILCLWPSLLAAQVTYSRADLDRVQARAVPTILSVFEDDILGNLPRAYRQQARNIRLEFPDTGPSPLSFYAEPARQTITMPLASIRFFDDMATVFAWFEARQCQPEYIQSYLHALLRQGRPLPAPLTAFAIDRDIAFADAYTYDVSGKILSSGIQFILAHEVGHLLLNHRTDVDSIGSQRQEEEADRFALEHFARLGGSPMGVFWFYMMAWWQDPVTQDRRDHSHPVSPQRITALSDRLLANPIDFAHGEADPAREAAFIGQLGQMIAELSTLIDDDGMLTLMPLTLERDFPVSRLELACPTS